MRNSRKIAYFPLQGGEDLVTPFYSRRPGTLVGSLNFECDASGRYRRVQGYERFDGQTAPSSESYWRLPFKAGTAAISAGDTVTGATSSATGIALYDATVLSGAYVDGDAAGCLILRSVSGTFQYEENLQVSAVTKCVSDGRAIKRGDSSNDTTYYRAAVEAARDDISAVPGSGDILGVWVYNGAVYAFRNNAGGTAAVMYKSSAAGWTQVSLGHYLNFDGGTTAFTVGDTVTDGGTGATATIMKVVLTSGAWDGSGVGYLIVSSIVGTFTNNNALTDGAGGSATADGSTVAITLQPDGRYEFVNYNFGGHSGTLSMYGCDGENYAFEFDGTTFTPIRTGMTTDTPKHIIAHKKHLFLSFTGGSVQHSSTGVPLTWSPVTGASEIGIGQEITGFSEVPGGLLAIYGRRGISILYGSSSADWALKTLSVETGAVEWSIQKLSEPLFLDDFGISSLSSIEAYGDFKTSALSAIIEPYFTTYQQGALSCSVRVKSKTQYRIFYNDASGINLTFSGRKIAGFTRLEYEHVPVCACSGEDSSGNDVVYFGSTNGMVYQLEKGTSFDGSAIRALLKTSLASLGSPENKKRFFKLVLEKDDQMEEGEWGIGSWGNFEWGEQGEDRTESYLDETGTGYDYLYYESSAYKAPYVLQGVILHYSVGGLKR